MDQNILGHATPLVNAHNSLKSHPKALWILSSIKMWESFSFYGMRALLILFLTQKLKLTDTHSFFIYSTYAAMIEALAFLGGYLADRWIGILKSTQIGACIIGLGHLLLMQLPEHLFFIGLGTIVIGTGLFRTNVIALLDLSYLPGDARQLSGFTYFYSFINWGAFFSGLSCAVIGEKFGFHYGFGLAAIGMGIGLIIFYCGRAYLPKDVPIIHKTSSRISILGVIFTIPVVIGVLKYAEFFYPYLSIIFLGSFVYLLKKILVLSAEQRKKIGEIIIGVLFLVVFFAMEEQIGSSLILFSERFVECTIFGMHIPVSAIISMNPLVIIVSGPFLAQFVKGTDFSSILNRISIGFLCVTISYLILYLTASPALPIGIILFTFGLIAAGELFIGPAIWSLCGRNSPKEMKGQMMGLVTLGYAAANYLGGFLSRSMAVDAMSQNALVIYQNGFLTILIIALMSVLGAYALSYWIRPRRVCVFQNTRQGL